MAMMMMMMMLMLMLMMMIFLTLQHRRSPHVARKLKARLSRCHAREGSVFELAPQGFRVDPTPKPHHVCTFITQPVSRDTAPRRQQIIRHFGSWKAGDFRDDSLERLVGSPAASGSTSWARSKRDARSLQSATADLLVQALASSCSAISSRSRCGWLSPSCHSHRFDGPRRPA